MRLHPDDRNARFDETGSRPDRRALAPQLRGALTALVGWSLLIATASFAQPQWTQTFDLVPGWNAIYLSVRPNASDPAQVFDGVPVASVWTRGVEPGAVEFIGDTDDALLSQRGWLAYVPDGRDEALAPALADRVLESVEGNRGYLIQLEGEPIQLSITGTPLIPVINWQGNAFNLVGFPIDPEDPPTFRSYFSGSPAQNDQPVYQLLASGVWEPITAPNAAEMRYGEAYWVFSASQSDFIGPLAVSVPSSSGLAYGRSVPDFAVSLHNLLDQTVTVSLQELGSPDTVPLSYKSIETQAGPDHGKAKWPDLGDSLEISVPRRGFRTADLAVRRGDFSQAEVATVVSINNGAGMRWILPLTASAGGATGAASLSGAGGQSPLAGLWVGNVIIDKVSRPQIGSLVPVSTQGMANVCTGGANEGMMCSGPGDCPGLCTLTCAGGPNAGGACTLSSQATDCPGSSCIGQPRACGGGINVGLDCTDDDDCPGSACTAMGACRSGSRVGQPCAAESEDIDCPGSTCNTGSRCDGGINDGLACTQASGCSFRCDEAGGGSNFAMRVMIHVDGAGEVRLLKQVIQMWQNGTTKPDPDNPAFEIDDTPGRYVLLTDDTLIPNYTGSSLRDGVPVGKRLSTAHFDFPGNELAMQGDFGGTNTVSASITLDPEFPTNPYRHKFHPDHDNQDSFGQPREEAFEITRDIELAFSATDPTGRSNPAFGFDTVGGTYSEQLSGLHRTPIRVEGTFRLDRVAVIAELNQ